MKIALVQQRATDNIDANRERGLAAVRAAATAGAKLVCFAELAFEPFYPQNRPEAEVASLAETVPGPTTTAFMELAADLGVAIVLNLFELDGGKTFDCSPVIDRNGASGIRRAG